MKTAFRLPIGVKKDFIRDLIWLHQQQQHQKITNQRQQKQNTQAKTCICNADYQKGFVICFSRSTFDRFMDFSYKLVVQVFLVLQFSLPLDLYQMLSLVFHLVTQLSLIELSLTVENVLKCLR